jgi:hypothetical protein
MTSINEKLGLRRGGEAVDDETPGGPRAPDTRDRREVSVVSAHGRTTLAPPSRPGVLHLVLSRMGAAGMKARIDVKNRKEAELIQRALADPQVRAFVKVMGTLLALPSDRSRERVLRFIDDKLAEDDPHYVSVFTR